jgi:integrase/recombinase XerD
MAGHICRYLACRWKQRVNELCEEDVRAGCVWFRRKFPNNGSDVQVLVRFLRDNGLDYLEHDEIQEILSVIDRITPKGMRDYTLLATMFNTGARVQEILDLRACDLQLIKPFQLRLTGKGRRQRCCLLWPQTAQLLRQLCTELNIVATSETRIFQNRWNAPLTRFGVRHILKTCPAQAQSSIVALRSKRLHPHSMRYSTAIALLKSGVDLSTIAQWLEHASIETTNRYAVVDLEMKRKAIARIKPLQGSRNRAKLWRPQQSVLDWLEAL